MIGGFRPLIVLSLIMSFCNLFSMHDPRQDGGVAVIAIPSNALIAQTDRLPASVYYPHIPLAANVNIEAPEGYTLDEKQRFLIYSFKLVPFERLATRELVLDNSDFINLRVRALCDSSEYVGFFQDKAGNQKPLALYGAHGSGKKRIAKFIAKQAGMDFYEILPKWLMRLSLAEASNALESFFGALEKKMVPGLQEVKRKRRAVIYIHFCGLLDDFQTIENTQYLMQKLGYLALVVKLKEWSLKRSSNYVVISGYEHDRYSETKDFGECSKFVVSLPTQEERVKVLKLFRSKYVGNGYKGLADTYFPGAREAFKVEVERVLTDKVLENMALKFSKATGRELKEFVHDFCMQVLLDKRSHEQQIVGLLEKKVRIEKMTKDCEREVRIAKLEEKLRAELGNSCSHGPNLCQFI